MKRFQLDLTHCQLPDFWDDLPKIIPLVPGTHYLDFDVADEAINQQVRKIPTVLGNPDLPVGFNVENIPEGAVIRRLPDKP